MAHADVGTSTGSKTFAVGPVVSTTGLGVDGRVKINESFAVRAGVRGWNFSKDGTESVLSENETDLKWKFQLKLLHIPFVVDWHPIDGSGFFVSGGIAYNGNKVEFSSSPARNITMYGNVWTPAQIGTAKATLKFKNSVAPLMTIGYDGSLMDDSNFSFNCEAGLMYAGSPKIKTSFSGLIGQAVQAAQLQRDIDREANDAIKDAKKWLKWYPIFTLGFKYNL